MTVNVSMVGLSLIIMDGQVAEADRYLATLNRRKARMQAELRELEDRIAGVARQRDEAQARINATLDAARALNTDVYRL
jgi:vacuolar-type H+-ATPase subunit D/Vma8